MNAKIGRGGGAKRIYGMTTQPCVVVTKGLFGSGTRKVFFCRLKQTKPSYELFERTHFAMALSQVISSAGWGSAAKSKTKVVYNCRDRDQKKLRDSISCLMSSPPPGPRYLRSGHRKGKMEEKDIFPSILLFGLGPSRGRRVQHPSLLPRPVGRRSFIHSAGKEEEEGSFLSLPLLYLFPPPP